MRPLLQRVREHLPAARSTVRPDPFATLELQSRLARLSLEIGDLQCGEPTRHFALGHHARAALLAYDRTLDDACRLVGAPVPEPGATHRLLAEATLLQAGWTW